ncbi:filamentous hemagglutinin family protein, partial [Pseudomonas aeruginosa]|nr:filamentous hemagglutinin family protein [Pseudomonas aeruginosa]
LERYLDPANLAQGGTPLAEQPGKVVRAYESELAKWLNERFGFAGDAEQAQAFFAGLPAEQQRIFARQVYFAELRAGGREYNEVGGVRQGSYLRGRNAIAALFPERDPAGNPISYEGDIVMYGGAGVHTDFGGDIQLLSPGGRQVFGIEGEAPPSTAGIVTQGQGDIQAYSRDSILLGQSRIMTTFGGSILAWSAEGDINAGRGSQTTVVYTPPRRIYDAWGNVSLSPQVPSTGAGIATLNPIPEVAPGDIDLIAPLGTIDAGEAGIRVSGNVNVAALQVVNAANIQTQGQSSGIPLVASVNTGALTSASAAASSATQAAEDVSRQQQAAARQRMPSVITVQVLGFGNERLEPSRDGASRSPGYNPDSAVQVLGAGALGEQARSQLTDEERGNLIL